MNGELTLNVIMCKFFFADIDRTGGWRDGGVGGAVGGDVLDDKRQTEKAGKRTKQTITSTSKELELFGEGEGINWC